MKYFIVAIFALVAPIYGRPQAPAQPQTQPLAQHAQPQAQPLAQHAQPQPQHDVHGGSSTPATIVSQTEVVGADGSFNYSYETSDGVHVEQGGYLKQAAQGRSLDPNNPNATNDEIQVIQGSYSYTAPDGQQISLRYIADDNGFQPEGQHLPTAPPVPEGIARSLGEQQHQVQEQHSETHTVHQQSQLQEAVTQA